LQEEDHATAVFEFQRYESKVGVDLRPLEEETPASFPRKA
jgi:hypothetical protein